jgi:hypothetical protein
VKSEETAISISAKIYAEGGGEGQLYDTLFRKAWSDFFRAAGFGGRMPRIVRGKGRQRTFDLFKTEVENPKAGEIALLLVDSEDAVEATNTVWQHLKKRDGWNRPDGARDDQAFLMVQVMETWFLADRGMLHTYFGAQFTDAPLQAWPSLEAVPKSTVFSALDRATVRCAKPYSKGKVSYELLGKLNPALVTAACPHASDLLTRLRAIAVAASLE